MTKQRMTEAVNVFKLVNCRVWTFNHYKRMPQGARGFLDHVIVTPSGYVIFIEDKFGKDKLSDGQRDTATFLTCVGERNQYINYFLATDTTWEKAIDFVWKVLGWVE